MVPRITAGRSVLGRAGLVVAAALLAFTTSTASAAVGLKAESGWGVSFDGFVNAFAVDQFGNSGPQPARTAADALGPTTDHNTFRVRTGLLPGLFAFNVQSPELDGLKLGARIGFYPQIQTNGSRVLSLAGNAPAFGAQVDLREAFFTVEGGFGQVLAGRALNLFQGKNILTDMTLFGVGVQGAAVGAGGTTAGRIGYGYVYTSFGPQLRYTTPDRAGLKLAVAVGDPTTIDGALAGGPAASDVRLPELEAELSWSGKSGDVALQAWASGLFQKAWLPTGGDVTAAGGSGGLGASLGGLDLLASGFYGQGLGSFFMLQLDALDAAGKERRSGGFLLQGGYALGATRLGVSYGQNKKGETDADVAARAGGKAEIDTRRSVTAGVYHKVNDWLKVVGEYTWLQTKWFGGADRASNVAALGAFVLW